MRGARRGFEREMLEEKNRAGVVVLPHPLISERQFVNRGLMKYACLGYAEGLIVDAL